jgi:hypothetical protein
VRAALVPGEVFLLNSAPYLVFIDADFTSRLACLGVLNRLPFDWQARRFVETHLNFFILEGLVVPKMDGATARELAKVAGRLSCIDERYSEVAQEMDVECGPLNPTQRLSLRAKADAIVARAWGLRTTDVELLLTDFTKDAVTEEHRHLFLNGVG